MALQIFREIERLITEHGSAAILKERNSLLRDQIDILKSEFTKLDRENSDLKRRNAELEKRLAASEENEQFVEERGALFKRRPQGGYHNAVYCPKCRQSASPFPPGEEFNCTCGWFSAFTEDELPTIMRSLPT